MIQCIQVLNVFGRRNEKHLHRQPVDHGERFLLLSGGILSVLFSFIQVFERDTWIHLAVGRYIVEGSFPVTNTFSSLFPDYGWKNTEWLFDVILYSCFDLAGFLGVQILQIVLVSGAFLSILWIASRRMKGKQPVQIFSVLILITLALSVSRFRFPVRPHLVTYLGMAVLLVLWEIKPKRMALWVTILSTIWANCHAGVVFGLVVCIIFLVSAYFEEDRNGTRMAAVSTLAFFGGSLLNPYFTFPYLFAFLHLNLNKSFPMLNEFRAYVWGKDSLTLPFLGLLALLGVIQAVRQRNLLMPVSCLIFFPLVLFSIREIPGFVIVAFPGIAKAVGEALNTSFLKKRGIRSPLLVVILLLLFALVLGTADWARYGTQLKFGPGVNEALLPAPAADFINQRRLEGVMYNDFGLGGYLMWSLFPDRGVFQDGRVTAYPAWFLREVSGEEVILDSSRWRSIMDKYECQFGIVARNPFTGNPGVAALFETAEWPLVFFDGTAVIYVRPDSENDELTVADRFELVSLSASPQKLYDRGKRNPERMLLELERIDRNRLLVPYDPFRLAAAAMGAGDLNLMELFLERMWEIDRTSYDPISVARRLELIKRGRYRDLNSE